MSTRLISSLLDYLWATSGEDLANVVTSVTLSKKPQMTLRLKNKVRHVVNFDGSGPPDVSQEDWDLWGSDLVRTWWSVGFPAIPLVSRGEKVEGVLIEWAPYRVLDTGKTQAYHTAGLPVVYWKTPAGLYDIQAISPFHRGSFLVSSPHTLLPGERASILTELLDAPTGLPADTQESGSMSGKLSIEEASVEGPTRDAVVTAASWLRRVLPAHKVGAPTIEDVRMKLALEKRLRIEESVVGSSRPLAFTIEAIDDTTFHWPGLWLIVGSNDEFHKDFLTLLAWDAVLAGLVAATRMHVDVKPGLLYGPELSRTLLRNERRFSKRDVGTTEGAYCLVNPTRLVGPAAVVATRMLQAASHELAHVVTRNLRSHPEVMVTRRESLMLSGSDMLPEITELVEALSLHHRPSRPLSVGSISMTEWLTDALYRQSMTPVATLVKGWAALRNLTEGKAQRDVDEALRALPQFLFQVQGGYVYSFARV